MKALLFQIRNIGDPMLAQEQSCFLTKLHAFDEKHGLTMDCLNIIEKNDGYDSLWRDYDVVLVGGSGDYGCVNNTQDWFKYFCQVLRDIVTEDKPMFCSCFGHQALAAALGGAVSTDRSKAELGTLPVNLNEDGLKDPLLSSLSSPFAAQFGHNDFVSVLPQGAVNLASTPLCAVQAYRLEGKLVYATQFHPELSHLENRERAMRYLPVYAPDLASPEKLDELFRPSEGASDLLTRFLTMVVEFNNQIPVH